MSETEREQVTGLVAELVSDREIVINRGALHGVTEGMVFKVVDPIGVEITDPETGESLGSVQRVKVVVRAHEIAERFTIARTFRVKRRNVGGQMGTFQNIFAPPKWETRTETLRLDPGKGTPLSEDDSAVSVGDRVEEIPADEAENVENITLYR